MFGLALPGRRALQRLRREADAARDSKQYLKAATIYARILKQRPDDGPLHVQCGHVFKESGALDRAEQHYEQALRLMPDDADLALQFGHFYKVAGRFDEAEASYQRAVTLRPDDPEMTVQLAHLYRMTGRLEEAELYFRRGLELVPDAVEVAEDLAKLVGPDTNSLRMLKPLDLPHLPELAARAREKKLHPHLEGLGLPQIGQRQRTAWGTYITFRGVEAIRGSIISSRPVTELCMTLNGAVFHREGPLRGYPLQYESRDRRKQKYAFNVWHDFAGYTRGRYSFEIQWSIAGGIVRAHRDIVVIDDPLSTDDFPGSDRLVAITPGDKRPLDDQINTLPSVVRPAGRAVLPTPRNVLIVRADQLGDLVTSIAAIRRIRQLLPQARLVGLLSPANRELAETLQLFDEIIAVGFAEDEWEQRRVLSPDEQQALRQLLAPFKFDVAIDLSIAPDSRPLLALSGAPFVLGYADHRSSWLSGSMQIEARDPIDGSCSLSHSGQVAALVEYLGVLLGNRPPIIRRDDLARTRLAPYGLGVGPFVVLHTGARLRFSRWPHYDELAARLLDETGLKVVMMTDDPAKRGALPPELAGCDRFQLLDQRLPFDDFDAFLSFCSVFVGNDSGPSHLASLRGTPVVNLFMARHSWSEWGHENRGYIISRRVPCAGCNIHHEPDECCRGFACITNISPAEVFDAVAKLLQEQE